MNTKRLLIVTQTVNRNDPTLGFFHAWIEEIAGRVGKVTVICLKEGQHSFPENVRVYSLGKEKKGSNSIMIYHNSFSRLRYAARFVKLVFLLRREYSSVFVHMNQEYILLAGFLWKLLGKKIYLWRNHHQGDVLTDIAASFCNVVFCTSRYSYTAKYKKSVLMPVGIDTSLFAPRTDAPRIPGSILFLARLDPSKKPDVFLKILGRLREIGMQFSAALVGSPSYPNSDYEHFLRNRAQEYDLGGLISFRPGVPNREAANLFRQFDVFVNCSSSGMYDKTIFEAMSCGTLVLASNKNLEGQIDLRSVFKEGDIDEGANKLKALLELPEEEKEALREKGITYVTKHHSLALLGEKLVEQLF